MRRLKCKAEVRRLELPWKTQFASWKISALIDDHNVHLYCLKNHPLIQENHEICKKKSKQIFEDSPRECPKMWHFIVNVYWAFKIIIKHNEIHWILWNEVNFFLFVCIRIFCLFYCVPFWEEQTWINKMKFENWSNERIRVSFEVPQKKQTFSASRLQSERRRQRNQFISSSNQNDLVAKLSRLLPLTQNRSQVQLTRCSKLDSENVLHRSRVLLKFQRLACVKLDLCVFIALAVTS